MFSFGYSVVLDIVTTHYQFPLQTRTTHFPGLPAPSCFQCGCKGVLGQPVAERRRNTSVQKHRAFPSHCWGQELWQVRHLLAFIKIFFCFTSTFYISQPPKDPSAGIPGGLYYHIRVILCHCPGWATFPAPIPGCLLIRSAGSSRGVASRHHMQAERWDACPRVRVSLRAGVCVWPRGRDGGTISRALALRRSCVHLQYFGFFVRWSTVATIFASASQKLEFPDSWRARCRDSVLRNDFVVWTRRRVSN